ncbi:MAG: YtxH domain-containing protein [Acidobacteriota bacterium]
MTQNEGTSRGVGNKLLFLLVGGGIGAALALLFAPKSGDELRGDIADVTRRGYGTAVDKAKELKERSAEVVSNVKDKANELYLAAADKASTAGDIASNVVSDAKKRFTEGTQGLASDIQEDTKPITGGRKQSAIM